MPSKVLYLLLVEVLERKVLSSSETSTFDASSAYAAFFGSKSVANLEATIASSVKALVSAFASISRIYFSSPFRFASASSVTALQAAFQSCSTKLSLYL